MNDDIKERGLATEKPVIKKALELCDVLIEQNPEKMQDEGLNNAVDGLISSTKGDPDVLSSCKKTQEMAAKNINRKKAPVKRRGSSTEEENKPLESNPDLLNKLEAIADTFEELVDKSIAGKCTPEELQVDILSVSHHSFTLML